MIRNYEETFALIKVLKEKKNSVGKPQLYWPASFLREIGWLRSDWLNMLTRYKAELLDPNEKMTFELVRDFMEDIISRLEGLTLMGKINNNAFQFVFRAYFPDVMITDATVKQYSENIARFRKQRVGENVSPLKLKENDTTDL